MTIFLLKILCSIILPFTGVNNILKDQHPTDSNDLYNLTVTIEGIRENDGVLYICMATEQNQFLKDCFVQQSVEVAGQSQISVQLEAIPAGEYAISVFHDLNRNTKLDSRSVLQLPREPFGFSNNPKLYFGPPRFKDCRFRLDQNITEVVVHLRKL